jgi:antitoxin (DNA-binding transcriptional repressor) of toxin-antitoxin stability system
MATISAEQLTADLDDVLRRVEAGEDVEVTRDGRVVARIAAPAGREAASVEQVRAIWDAPSWQMALEPQR